MYKTLTFTSKQESGDFPPTPRWWLGSARQPKDKASPREASTQTNEKPHMTKSCSTCGPTTETHCGGGLLARGGLWLLRGAARNPKLLWTIGRRLRTQEPPNARARCCPAVQNMSPLCRAELGQEQRRCVWRIDVWRCHPLSRQRPWWCQRTTVRLRRVAARRTPLSIVCCPIVLWVGGPNRPLEHWLTLVRPPRDTRALLLIPTGNRRLPTLQLLHKLHGGGHESQWSATPAVARSEGEREPQTATQEDTEHLGFEPGQWRRGRANEWDCCHRPTLRPRECLLRVRQLWPNVAVQECLLQLHGCSVLSTVDTWTRFLELEQWWVNLSRYISPIGNVEAHFCQMPSARIGTLQVKCWTIAVRPNTISSATWGWRALIMGNASTQLAQ